MVDHSIDVLLYVIGVDCGPLPDIDNGRVSVSPDTRFLSIATYTCNLGFVIDNEQNRRRRCEANGAYSGSEPSCVGKNRTQFQVSLLLIP